jgi:cytoskeletal protein CcmA (bactofilin family)
LLSELTISNERPARGSVVIGRGVTIVGSLFYDGQIQIEGRIYGEVRCSALQIAERGTVEGLIVAKSVDVLGETNGSIYADKLVLRAACAVEGEIYHHNLVLEDGCHFEGKSRRHINPLGLAPVSGSLRALACLRTAESRFRCLN